MIIHNPILTGSFTVNGTDVSSITSSAASLTSLNAYTASQNIRNGTYATTGSNTFAGIQTVNSNLVVTGSITAQTLVVQTVTSSVVYSSGSNVFGNNIANTQTFTGSVLVTGSITSQGGFILGNSATIAPTGSIGYNNTVGVFIYGKSGSEADFRLYNRDGLTAMSVVAGTQNINFNSSATFGSDVFTYNNGGIFFSGGGVYTSGIFQNVNGLQLQSGGAPRLTIASNGAASFSGSVTSGGKITSATGAFRQGGFYIPYSGGGAASRTWAVTNDEIAFGDFAILTSTTQTGDVNLYRFYISPSGQVAIGTTNPSGNGTQKFVVQASAAAEIARFTDGTNADIVFDTPTEQFARITAQYGAGGNLIFARGTGRLESMRITSDGVVSINNTSPNAAYILGIRMADATKRNGIDLINVYEGMSTAGVNISCYNAVNGIVSMQVLGNGNLVNYNNSYGAISDTKLKENIVDAKPKLDDILKLKVRNFNFINAEEKQIGFVAQELEEVFPSLIEEARNPNTDETFKTIKTSVLVPILVKAIQELQAQINELKNN
jgi:hypothetical protein